MVPKVSLQPHVHLHSIIYHIHIQLDNHLCSFTDAIAPSVYASSYKGGTTDNGSHRWMNEVKRRPFAFKVSNATSFVPAANSEVQATVSRQGNREEV